MTSWLPASVANHLWQSTLFVALAWLVTLALRRHGARVRYSLWAAASLKFFLPFSWLIGLGTLVEWRTAPTIAQPAATFVMQEILAAPLVYGAVPQVPRASLGGSSSSSGSQELWQCWSGGADTGVPCERRCAVQRHCRSVPPSPRRRGAGRIATRASSR